MVIAIFYLGLAIPPNADPVPSTTNSTHSNISSPTTPGFKSTTTTTTTTTTIITTTTSTYSTTTTTTTASTTTATTYRHSK